LIAIPRSGRRRILAPVDLDQKRTVDDVVPGAAQRATNLDKMVAVLKHPVTNPSPAAACELAGHAHGITIDPVSGMRVGGADPRSDGAAIGY